MAEFFDHEDEMEFSEIPIPDSITMYPIGAENILINGPAITTQTVTITNRTPRNPKRDAMMLSAFLVCSLEEQVLYLLAERLYKEVLLPYMQESVSLLGSIQANSAKSKPKKSPKNPDPPEDES